MHSTSDFRKGLRLLINGEPYVITDFQHIKPGKGNQFTRTKLRNMITGSNLDRTIKSGEKFEVPDVEILDHQFLYKDEGGYHFMNPSNYEQVDLNDDDVGDNKFYLIENLNCSVLFFNGRAIGIEVPNTVQLTVTQTDPGLKGNTVTGGTKPATLETGLVVKVPLHINEGDVLKVDCRTGDYMERVNS